MHIYDIIMLHTIFEKRKISIHELIDRFPPVAMVMKQNLYGCFKFNEFKRRNWYELNSRMMKNIFFLKFSLTGCDKWM